MIRRADPNNLHTEFLCTLSEGLVSGRIPRDRLTELLSDCPAELQDRWLANAKVVVLLNHVWPNPRRPG